MPTSDRRPQVVRQRAERPDLNLRGSAKPIPAPTGHVTPRPDTFDAPGVPPTFTKVPSCLAGPSAAVELPSGRVDWEVELVAVMGRPAQWVPEDKAWSYVAGVMVGQDLSERTVQPAGPVPQFSLGKPFPGFGPIGPWLVTPNEPPDRGDLRLCCSVGGRVLQDGPTRDMIFSARELVARIYAACLILPGDLIFTGIPPGGSDGGGRRRSSSGLVQRWRARSRTW
jgi:2-keto-4-pentenoate hydratase/2-oxohepta-3-ene-1,7-dioic acid hydratase in catechol pathway